MVNYKKFKEKKIKTMEVSKQRTGEKLNGCRATRGGRLCTRKTKVPIPTFAHQLRDGRRGI